MEVVNLKQKINKLRCNMLPSEKAIAQYKHTVNKHSNSEKVKADINAIKKLYSILDDLYMTRKNI